MMRPELSHLSQRALPPEVFDVDALMQLMRHDQFVPNGHVRRRSDRLFAMVRNGLADLGIADMADFCQAVSAGAISREQSMPILELAAKYHQAREHDVVIKDWSKLVVKDSLDVGVHVSDICGVLGNGDLLVNKQDDEGSVLYAAVLDGTSGIQKNSIPTGGTALGVTKDAVITQQMSLITLRNQTDGNPEIIALMGPSGAVTYNPMSENVTQFFRDKGVVWIGRHIGMTARDTDVGLLPKDYDRVFGMVGDEWLVCGSRDGHTIDIVRCADGQTPEVTYSHTSKVSTTVADVVGDSVFYLDGDGLWYWDFLRDNTRRCFSSLDLDSLYHGRICMHPDDPDTFAVLDKHYALRVYDRRTPRPVHVYPERFFAYRLLAAPDGKIIASSGKTMQILCSPDA